MVLLHVTILSHYNFTTKLRFYYHKTIFTITLRFYYHIMILLLRNKFTTMYNVSLLYLSYNMGKVPRKLIKLQCYLIFQPSEAVILARRMKELLCRKLSLLYNIWDLSNYWEYLHHQILNLPNDPLKWPLMTVMLFHSWKSYLCRRHTMVIFNKKKIFEMIYRQEQLFTGVWKHFVKFME